MKHSILSRLQRLESNAIDSAPSPPFLVLFSTEPEPDGLPKDAHVIRFNVQDAVSDIKVTRGANHENNLRC